ncbi:hypothetical protein L7F22_033737 [Adiantum nelumboides]|nr:hypothetical protein [Adiantum nelumboides]
MAFEADILTKWQAKDMTVDSKLQLEVLGCLLSSGLKLQNQFKIYCCGLPKELKRYLHQAESILYLGHDGTCRGWLWTLRGRQCKKNKNKRTFGEGNKSSIPCILEGQRSQWYKVGKCFTCGETGHMSARCSTKGNGSRSHTHEEPKNKKAKTSVRLVIDLIRKKLDESIELCRAWGKV